MRDEWQRPRCWVEVQQEGEAEALENATPNQMRGAQCKAEMNFCFSIFWAEALKKTQSVWLWLKGPAKMCTVCFY